MRNIESIRLELNTINLIVEEESYDMVGKRSLSRKASQQAIPSLLCCTNILSPSTPFPDTSTGANTHMNACTYSLVCVCVYMIWCLDGGAELDENSELGQHILKRFPLHMYARLERIRHTWVTFWKMDKVRTYVQ